MTDMPNFRAAVLPRPTAAQMAQIEMARAALGDINSDVLQEIIIGELESRRRDGSIDFEKFGNRISRLSLSDLARNMLAGVRG
jgi:hypothetical protein